MSSIPQPPTGVARERPQWSLRLLVAETWASIAITVMWIAVSITAVWGPDLVSHDVSGSSTTIPSGVIVAAFATLGSWAVAKHGFARPSASEDGSRR